LHQKAGFAADLGLAVVGHIDCPGQTADRMPPKSCPAAEEVVEQIAPLPAAVVEAEQIGRDRHTADFAVAGEGVEQIGHRHRAGLVVAVGEAAAAGRHTADFVAEEGAEQTDHFRRTAIAAAVDVEEGAARTDRLRRMADSELGFLRIHSHYLGSVAVETEIQRNLVEEN
jgi:hypothetical protein